MGIDKFGFGNVRSKIQQHTGYDPDSSEAIRRRLMFIGEECCNHARLNGQYTDRTGCLRSSIGYRLYHNGELVGDGGFGGSQHEGIAAAKKAIDRFSNPEGINPVGWTLIMVAGMSYATYVEAKGYNVLHLTEIELNDKIEALCKELKLTKGK